MGIFSRIKNAVRSKANAAIDKAVDPEKELDIAIMELEEQRKKALEELLSYKSTAKSMEQDIEKYETKAKEWEKRAMLAVKNGDDEMAKTALREQKTCQAEAERIKRDRDEAASYAIELNRSRKEAETKLKILKMKKGTMATQLAAARSGNTNAFGHDDGVWDRFERAEEAIEAESIETEVDAALAGEEALEADFDRQLLAAGGDPRSAAGTTADDPLAQLKAKMAAEKSRKKLPAGSGGEGAKPEGATETTAGDADESKGDGGA